MFYGNPLLYQSDPVKTCVYVRVRSVEKQVWLTLLDLCVFRNVS